MIATSVTAAVLLFGYLAIMARRKGIPDMVSDTFYQLGTGKGWMFSAVLTLSAVLMMVALLSSGWGLQAGAFVGCMGLAFVGMAPNYLDKDEYKVHKTAAIIAAVGSVVWCVSVTAWPTVTLAAAFLAYLSALTVSKSLWGIWWLAPLKEAWHPWYWAEVLAIADTFITYWVRHVMEIL